MYHSRSGDIHLDLASGIRGGVRTIRFTPDSSRVAGVSPLGCVQVWNLASSSMVMCYDEVLRPVHDLQFLLGGSELLAFSTAAIDIYGLVSEDHISSRILRAGNIRSAFLSADGKLAVTASPSNAVHLWRTGDAGCVGPVQKRRSDKLVHGAFVMDARVVVTAWEDGSVGFKGVLCVW